MTAHPASPRAIMGGQRVPLLAKVRSAWTIYRAHRRSLFSNARAAVQYHRNLVSYLERGTGLPPDKARVLDLGCGQQAVQTVLFHAAGAEVTGIDAEVPTFRMTPRVLARSARANGLERAAKSLVRAALFDRSFFAGLAREAGRPLDLAGVDVRVMDAKAMAFPEGTFDFVFSTAVFEHIDDVPAAAREVNRVLRPGGLAVITPHLFPSLSGGHNLEWAAPDAHPSGVVPAWDHLRENRFPVNLYLNRLAWRDYRAAFRGALEVVEEVPEREGEALLTSALEAELGARGWTREDLTTKTVMFFCRKRQ